MADERKQQINPGLLFMLYILGGGVTGGATNLLIPKDAPDRYTGTHARQDWAEQKHINEQILQEHKSLREKISNVQSCCQICRTLINFDMETYRNEHNYQ